MSALPPDQIRAMREAIVLSHPAVAEMEQQWIDLHVGAANVARAAGLKPESIDAQLAAFPTLLCEAGEWQREMVKQGVEDMDAMMNTGSAALETIAARGLDASVPALALWREFYFAREAVLTLVSVNAEAVPLA